MKETAFLEEREGAFFLLKEDPLAKKLAKKSYLYCIFRKLAQPYSPASEKLQAR